MAWPDELKGGLSPGDGLFHDTDLWQHISYLDGKVVKQSKKLDVLYGELAQREGQLQKLERQTEELGADKLALRELAAQHKRATDQATLDAAQVAKEKAQLEAEKQALAADNQGLQELVEAMRVVALQKVAHHKHAASQATLDAARLAEEKAQLEAEKWALEAKKQALEAENQALHELVARHRSATDKNDLFPPSNRPTRPLPAPQQRLASPLPVQPRSHSSKHSHAYGHDITVAGALQQRVHATPRTATILEAVANKQANQDGDKENNPGKRKVPAADKQTGKPVKTPRKEVPADGDE
ncbi:hypothetical protein WJX72_002167 [[Myrmecia] bisecta]|uniref:Uncharacterized protein n=1 Tax=[Myrmecia] bisecta TaxID=41462 RepID=A0AAW1PKU6_9CHLO